MSDSSLPHLEKSDVEKSHPLWSTGKPPAREELSYLRRLPFLLRRQPPAKKQKFNLLNSKVVKYVQLSEPASSILQPSKPPTRKLRLHFRPIFGVISLLILLIAIAVGVLLYVDRRPSEVKAYSYLKELLPDITTAEFGVYISYELYSQSLQGQQADRGIVVIKGDARLDRTAHQLLFVGNVKAPYESYEITQVVDGNNVYLKYLDKNYVLSNDIRDAIFVPDDWDLHNPFLSPSLIDQYGYGGIDKQTGADAYRFRLYPADALVEEYLAEFVANQVLDLYSFDPPAIITSKSLFTDYSYRIWAGATDYLPRRIMVSIANISLDLGVKGTLILRDFTCQLDINSINSPVMIEIPVLTY